MTLMPSFCSGEGRARPTEEADRYTLLRRVAFLIRQACRNVRGNRSVHSRPVRCQASRSLTTCSIRRGFGDHWARHWFDLSCYADLADIQRNMLIRDAWRYRDYVINAFSTDKPLDRFIHEQIAGDLLRLSVRAAA